MAKKDQNTVLTKEVLEKKILNFFETEEIIPYNYKQVSASIGVFTPRDFALTVEILEELALANVLTETTPGKFKAKKQLIISALWLSQNITCQRHKFKSLF
jgi:hypothetical protein